MRYVIIGNGVAGITAAETIRQYDQEAGITLIGDESAVPYCRPMISLVLEGAIAPEKLPITGSMNVMKLLTEGLEEAVGATFAVEPDPEKAAVLIRRRIENRREKLGLPALAV